MRRRLVLDHLLEVMLLAVLVISLLVYVSRH